MSLLSGDHAKAVKELDTPNSLGWNAPVLRFWDRRPNQLAVSRAIVYAERKVL